MGILVDEQGIRQKLRRALEEIDTKKIGGLLKSLPRSKVLFLRETIWVDSVVDWGAINCALMSLSSYTAVISYQERAL